MARRIAVVILRSDLRIHDHALFHSVHSQKHKGVTHVLPVYVFDERFIELSGLPGYERQGPEARTRLFGFWRTGVFRARFLAEAVYDLRDNLRARGSDLLIRFGKLEQVLESVVDAIKQDGDVVERALYNLDFCSEEQAIERRIDKIMHKRGIEIETHDTTPLIDVRDLPFPVAQTPDVFTPFRKRVEGLGFLGRAPLIMPSKFKPFPVLSSGPYPAYGDQLDGKSVDDIIDPLLKPLEDTFEIKYKHASTPRDSKSAFPYAGGETSALSRLNFYFKEGNPPPVARYKATRNGLLGHEYSTKLSPFLCLGMISPRLIMQALDEHEQEFGETQNTYWVRFELLWRDYFLYMARKFGSKLFTLGGFEEVTDPKQAQIKSQPGWWKTWDRSAGDDDVVTRWLTGKTGVPFIDANMAELRESGFMSNRGRQNVASFLTKDLQVDWRIGAEYFESHLIDYEPTANYGNWQYVGGVGNDPRASRQFNPIKQANDYDPQGQYIKTWIPELRNVPSSRIQCPWTLSRQDFQEFVIGNQLNDKEGHKEPYPSKPVIEQGNWKPHYVKKGSGKLNGNKNERARNPGPGGHGMKGGMSKDGTSAKR
ncbi:hypothetical protein ACM66B_001144 [Microbotryomycetes sp. NB124-2]